MKNLRTNHLFVTLILVNAFVAIPPALYAPFLSTYYSKTGLNGMETGLLMTIGPLVAIFLQPLWAALSDSSGRRKDVLSLLAFGSGAALLVYCLGSSFPVLCTATFLLALFATAIGPLCDAIEITTAKEHHLDFSLIRMGGTMSYAIMVIIAGYMIRLNPIYEFILGFIGYMVLLFFIRKLPNEKSVRRASNIKSIRQKTLPAYPMSHPTYEKKKPGTFKLFDSGQIYFMLLFAFVIQIAITFNNSFLGVYMSQLGYSEGIIGFTNCVAAVSEIPVLLIINRLMYRIKPIWLIALAGHLMGLRILMTTKESLGYILFAQAMNGLTYMVIYYCCATYISRNVRAADRSKGQSLLTIVQAGFGSIVGNLVGGYFCDTIGIRTAYVQIAAVTIGASAFLSMLQIFILSRETAETEKHII